MKTLTRYFLTVFALLLLTGFALNDRDPFNLDGISIILKRQTDEIILLKVEVRELKEKINVLNNDIDNEKIAAIPAVYFAKVGYFEKDNPFPRNPDYMRLIWSYCKKYRSLLSPEAKKSAKDAKIIPEYFVFVWPAKESHYNPFLKCDNRDEKNRLISIDFNLTQINSGSRKDPKTGIEYQTMDAWNHLFAQLPDELKKKKCNPFRDPEIGIAMLYLWINERVRLGMAWAYLNDWTWNLYWQCKRTRNG